MPTIPKVAFVTGIARLHAAPNIEAHLRSTLQTYARCYDDVRTHRSLDEDAPTSRPVQRTSIISSRSALGGLQYHYLWV